MTRSRGVIEIVRLFAADPRRGIYRGRDGVLYVDHGGGAISDTDLAALLAAKLVCVIHKEDDTYRQARNEVLHHWGAKP